jgi:RDD family
MGNSRLSAHIAFRERGSDAAVTQTDWEIRCSGCGAAVPSTAAQCDVCGTTMLGPVPLPLPPEPQPQPPEEETWSDKEAKRIAASHLLLSPARPVTWADLDRVGRRGYGGFWMRVAAWFVDYLAVGIFVAIAATALGPIASLFLLPFLLLYSPIMESSGWQGTVGKRLFGLVVTDADGRPISFGHAVLRLLAKVLSALPLGAGFLMIAFNSRKRGLHDLLAGTLVVRR